MVDSAFDDEWKLEVEEKVLDYSKQNFKYLELENRRIRDIYVVRCIKKLNKTGGGDCIVWVSYLSTEESA